MHAYHYHSVSLLFMQPFSSRLYYVCNTFFRGWEIVLIFYFVWHYLLKIKSDKTLKNRITKLVTFFYSSIDRASVKVIGTHMTIKWCISWMHCMSFGSKKHLANKSFRCSLCLPLVSQTASDLCQWMNQCCYVHPKLCRWSKVTFLWKKCCNFQKMYL